MKRIFLLCAALAAPQAAFAAPYCNALLHTDQMPKKYAKKGPFHSNDQTGWIVATDQTKANFTPTAQAKELWALIDAEFAARGVQLTALIAPPRPLFAPDRGQALGYDAVSATAAFSGYIADLNAAGITAPDLSELDHAANASEYYFARDTHWTPMGATWSAAYFAQSLMGTPVNETLANVTFTGEYAEKGSLSAVVENVCGTRPNAETVPAPSFAQRGDAASLLDASSASTVALIGTSFSNRYQRDAYQVADALANALQTDVENFSVTGGGLVGAMDAFISSGAVDSGQFQTVIWETPYTTPLTDVNGLRQILGSLKAKGEKTTLYQGSLSKDWTTVKHPFQPSAFQSLGVQTPGVTSGKLEIELRTADGEKQRTILIKSDRVNANERSDEWTMSLAGLGLKQVSRVKVKLNGSAQDAAIYLTK